jgi:hypothetical protein
LSVDYSQSLDELFTVFGAGGLGVMPSVEWLRDGTPISGATDQTYAPTEADAGRDIAARLTYTGLGLAYMQQIFGAADVPSVTTPAVTVTKKSAKTFIRMVRNVITTKQRGVVRVDVTSPDSIVTGRTTITVGDWDVTRSLRNGRVTVRLPALRAGKYVVHANFLGSGEYRSSRAKPKNLTVTK